MVVGSCGFCFGLTHFVVVQTKHNDVHMGLNNTEMLLEQAYYTGSPTAWLIMLGDAKSASSAYNTTICGLSKAKLVWYLVSGIEIGTALRYT